MIGVEVDVPEIFCSTIIPTINRPTLTRAVESVLNQSLDTTDFEVIVVNDSGHPLPDMNWQHCERVRVIDTNRRERSVARNTGAAIARGKYLHFLDDDDVLLPGALESFWQLDRDGSDAIWLYGSYRTVDNDSNLIEEIYPNISGSAFSLLVAGESIPLQASLLHADRFDAAGAFDPTIVGVEDRDLGRRIASFGMISYTPAIVASIRIGEQGSTTNWALLAEDDRRGREKAFSIQYAFAVLRKSADSTYWYERAISAYSRGRVCRAYFASMVWNVRHRNLFIAMSRGLAGLAFPGKEILTPDFWSGLRGVDLDPPHQAMPATALVDRRYAAVSPRS